MTTNRRKEETKKNIVRLLEKYFDYGKRKELD